MSWAHCGIEAIPDTEGCPECGATKESWTLEFEATRQFVLRRGPALRIVLLDAHDEGVPGEAYRVELPGGEVVEGALDEGGFGRVPCPAAGECRVTFPHRGAGLVLREPEEGEHDAAAEDAAEGEEGEGGEAPGAEGVATFGVPADRRHAFRLAAEGVLDLVLYDEEGHAPLAEVEYELAGLRGLRLFGRTDGDGRLAHGQVPLCTFALSIAEATVPVPSVLEEDAGLPVRVHGVPREGGAGAEPEDGAQGAPGAPAPPEGDPDEDEDPDWFREEPGALPEGEHEEEAP